MTIEELISQVNSLGLRVNNLFQIPQDGWQANLTDGTRFWEFGKGETPTEALLAALNKHATTAPEMGLPQTTTTTTTTKLHQQSVARAPKGRLVL